MSVFLNDTKLTGINKAALWMLYQNEDGGQDYNGLTLRPPSGIDKSGWTIGLAQLDFNTNPVAAQNLLVSVLKAGGYRSQHGSVDCTSLYGGEDFEFRLPSSGRYPAGGQCRGNLDGGSGRNSP